MVLKKIGYVNDPIQTTDVFKLTCYHTCEVYETDITYKDILTIPNTDVTRPIIEELVKLNKDWIKWRKWVNVDYVHTQGEYERQWNGNQYDIIDKFKDLYGKLSKFAFEQFTLIDHITLNDSGYIIEYIDKDGKEFNLESTEEGRN